ncbi:MAG: exodeoxyribonuclease VII large subunit [Bacteroidales bacterium]
MIHSQELSLFQLNNIVRDAVKTCFPDRYWVRAELSDVRESGPGHCYVEFVEKENRTGQMIAKARGSIWANRWKLLKPFFEQETNQKFTSGIKVLVEVSVEFHELYGYSLIVNDIDPSYTLGDMARNRAEILKKLQEEGVKDMNKELELAPLPNRIAIISSSTAAGYGDFMNQLEQNEKGFPFYTHLFPAVMQGGQTEASIIDALNRIYQYQELFDAVVIIRGGGATSDLNSFDSYQLALNCAQFPLPLIVGIGHERDETVLDAIAHTRVKTPTAAAEFLIGRMDEAYDEVLALESLINQEVNDRLDAESRKLALLTERIPLMVQQRIEREKSRMEVMQTGIVARVNRLVGDEKNKLQLLSARIPQLAQTMVASRRMRLEFLQENILRAVPQQIEKAQRELQNMEKIVELVSPEAILKKGYSLTLVNGKVVHQVQDLRRGDRVTTLFADGTAESIITDLNYKTK